jgi:hypothetical protein
LLESPAILIGGIFALLELVLAALFDVFKRDRHRYNTLPRSASQRMFRVFLGITLIEWTVLVLMQLLLVPASIGWIAFAICYVVQIFMLHKDFARRRTDVVNGLFRIAQYQFLAAAVALVGISYYVHSRPNPPASTTPDAASGPGVPDRTGATGRDLLGE